MNQKRMLESNLMCRVTDTEHELEVERSEKEQYKEECRELQEKIDQCKHKQANKALNAELKKMAYGKLLSDREAYVAVCSRGALVLTVICLVSILVTVLVSLL